MTLGERSVKMMWDGGPLTLLVPDCLFFTPVTKSQKQVTLTVGGLCVT